MEGDEESLYNLSLPRLVILDGLDECGDGNTQKYILEVLSRAVVQMSFPLIFLIASRPEPAIRKSFNKVSMNNITTRLPLDNTYEPDADIKVVIESKCEEIRETHPARASLPSPWPSDHEIKQLVRKSSGQFIYTSTVLKFIESPKHRPQDRLNIILGNVKWRERGYGIFQAIEKHARTRYGYNDCSWNRRPSWCSTT